MIRLAVVALVLVGCSKKDPGPGCDKVTDHILDVTKQQMSAHGDMQMGNRKVMVEQCEKRNLSPEVRNCLMKAASLAAIAECQPKPPEQPAGSGG